MLRMQCSVIAVALALTSPVFGASHNIKDGFNFGVGGPVNPNNGWTFADHSANTLTTYTTDWNAPDFAPGQPGWEGPPGLGHAGWAKLNADNALASGYEVVADE